MAEDKAARGVKVALIALGCDKNLVDAERMLGALAEAGYALTDDAAEADVIIVNTCCFIMDAKEESIQALIDYGRYKSEGRCRALIAAGCLAQRYAQEIHQELPEVDAVVGTTAYDEITSLVDALTREDGKREDGKQGDMLRPLDRLVHGGRRIVSTGGHYAHLKIAEGCDKRCSYCIIPSIRGPYRSVPMEALLEEARTLVDGGVRELILVAQETTLYGIDLYGEKKLPELLRRLAAIEELRWIRLLYCYPEEIDDQLIEVMATEPKVCHYLDMPIQHSEDGVLQRMGRRTTRADIMERITRIRERIPDIALRTTLITGFPGETQAEHQGMLDFVGEAAFDRLGVFTYSAEEGTAAAEMPAQVDEAVKSARREEVMALQQEIAYRKANAQVGRELDVFVEGRIPEEGVLVCRSYMDAPEVDGYVFVESEEEPMSGTMLRVRITGSEGYDLVGEML